MYKLTCRRGFLKSSLYFATSLFCAKPALAKVFDGRPRAPEGKLSLHNLNSDERLTVTYRNELGVYDSEALKALNWALRCHASNETTNMDLRVIEYLHRLDQRAGRRPRDPDHLRVPLPDLQPPTADLLPGRRQAQPAHEGEGDRFRHRRHRARHHQAHGQELRHGRRRVLPEARFRPHRLRSFPDLVAGNDDHAARCPPLSCSRRSRGRPSCPPPC